jgi:hypothetical protein
MRLFLIFLLLFFAFALTGCSQPLQNIVDKSPIEDAYSWDFGKAKEGEILKHNFLLKNDSTKPLKIQSINTSCSCTVSKVKKKTLLQGESTYIEVEFNTKGYSGLNEQYIYVQTDNLDNPILRFIIKAEILSTKK